MNTTDAKASTGRPGRRWFQFSLRQLLVGMSICAVVVAWLKYPIIQTRHEKQVAARVEQLGGSVAWGGLVEGRGKKGRSYIGAVDLSGTQVSDDDLAEIASLPELTHLNLNDAQIGSEGLAHLAKMSQIKQLELSGTLTTDDDLRQLAELSTLEVLKLEHCQITDEGLRHIAGSTSLWMLHIDGASVTKNGLLHLIGLRNLRTLSIRGTQVSDEGLQLLHGMNQLEMLFVDGTAVSEQGVAEINRVLSNQPAIP